MNTINFIIVVSIALLSTDLIYHQVYGQTIMHRDNKTGQLIPFHSIPSPRFNQPDTNCILHKDNQTVILNMKCVLVKDDIALFSSQGYEIKALDGNVMFMQKVTVK